MNTAFKSIFNYIETRKYILLFSFVYFLIRLIKLDAYFFLRDERDLILSALALAQTGKDLYGNVYPLIFSRISPQSPLIGMYWVVPIIRMLHITQPISVKILYILPTLFFPVLVFEFVSLLTKKKGLSFLTAVMVSFTPWYYHISRLGVEAHLAYFFCLIGLVLYIKHKKWQGLIFIILSYFSYYGLRPFLLVAIPYIELYNHSQHGNLQWKKLTISLLIFCAVFISVFFLGSRFENTQARSNTEVIFLNREKLSLETDFLRQISSAPFTLRKFFDNKATVITHTITNNLFKGLDVSYLFATGDYVAIYSNQITGQFFPFLAVFFIMGLSYLAIKKRWDYFFVAGFAVLGLVSSLINSYSLTFSIRSIFSLIGIGFIIALGVVYGYEVLTRKWKITLAVSLLALYALSSINFGYKYLFQNYNVINSIYNEEERYIARFADTKKVSVVFVPNIHSYFLSYVSNLHSLSPELFKKIQQELNKKDGYALNTHQFKTCSINQTAMNPADTYPTSTLIEASCLSQKTRLFFELNKNDKIVKLPDTEYKNNDINKNTRFYFFK